jgi:hypothetical protein
MLVDWIEDGQFLCLSVQGVDRRASKTKDVLHGKTFERLVDGEARREEQSLIQRDTGVVKYVYGWYVI